MSGFENMSDLGNALPEMLRHRQVSERQDGGLQKKSSRSSMKLMGLEEYMYQKAFVEANFSDVTLKSFGKEYKLHKIILCRCSFFATMLGGLWNCGEREKHTFDVNFDHDKNMTQGAFELAIKSLYGNKDYQKTEGDDLFNLLAVANYLDLPDLVEFCVSEVIESIDQHNAGTIAIFCCDYEYGRSTKKILEGCKSFLCSELYHMSGQGADMSMFENYPASVMGEVLSSDGLFVPSEWERCQLFVRYYFCKADWFTNVNQYDGSKELDDDENEEAVGPLQAQMEEIDRIRAALNEGIHFCHIPAAKILELESKKDVRQRPLFSKQVLRDGLWLQVEQKMRITSADEFSDDLGLAVSNFLQNDEHVYYPLPCVEEEDLDSTWTKFPPFRFAVSFPDVSSLQVGERRYSDTKWYGGSHWNIYIQKVAYKNGYQWGVYLHRAKVDRKGYVVNQGINTDVRPTAFTQDDGDTTLAMETAIQGSESSDEYSDEDLSPSAIGTHVSHDPFGPSSPRRWDNTFATPIKKKVHHTKEQLQDLGDYIDFRPRVKAYFEIYSPSRKGSTALTRFSSSPDSFHIAQSWGWKSASLASTLKERNSKDLNFMVVIGLV